MRYIVDVPPELAERMNEQVRSGRYKSPQDFLITAIHNQVYLESQEVAEIVSDTSSSASASSVPSGVSASSSGRLSRTLAIQLLSPEVTSMKAVPLSNFERPSVLWGQYNRFFPIKIVTRVCANLVKESSSGYIFLTELQERSADIARELGRTIQRKDKQFGRKRGTIISAGLPVGSDVDKAKWRFKNQFVGHVAGRRIEGAAPTLKFLTMIHDEKNATLVGLTDFGVKFASLSNPILDNEDYSLALSSEEEEFLLDHIASEVPREADLMKLVLTNVKKGVASPEELNERVKTYFSDWKMNEVIMMRAGVTSRMGELGLVTRRKNGVKVTYLLTDLGEKYLTKLSKLER
jgi:hypothetical protein